MFQNLQNVFNLTCENVRIIETYFGFIYSGAWYKGNMQYFDIHFHGIINIKGR